MIGLLLHLPDYFFIPEPAESHRWFGAGFMFMGILLLVENLAGGVWFRSKFRAAIWPVGAMGMGWGLLVVAGLDPADRVIHLTTGVVVLVAGYVEMRYRFGEVTRSTADMFVVPALLLAGFEMGVIHGKGDLYTAVGHAILGGTAAMMAAVRLYQSRAPTSFSRMSLTGSLVLLLSFNLLLLQP